MWKILFLSFFTLNQPSSTVTFNEMIDTFNNKQIIRKSDIRKLVNLSNICEPKGGVVLPLLVYKNNLLLTATPMFDIEENKKEFKKSFDIVSKNC